MLVTNEVIPFRLVTKKIAHVNEDIVDNKGNDDNKDNEDNKDNDDDVRRLVFQHTFLWKDLLWCISM